MKLQHVQWPNALIKTNLSTKNDCQDKDEELFLTQHTQDNILSLWLQGISIKHEPKITPFATPLFNIN